MNKMVINHLEKLYVTNDAATITEQLEVQHPAAKLVVTAAQSQQQEIGDGTNFVSGASSRTFSQQGWHGRRGTLACQASRSVLLLSCC